MNNPITDRQAQIIEASGKLLIQKGIKGLTTKNLAQEIGFTEGALYRHFKSKEDIIALLLNHFAESIQNRLDSILNNEQSSEIQLIKTFDSQFTFLQKNPHFVIAILSEGLFDESEKINSAINHVFNVKMNFLNQILKSGKQNGEFTIKLENKEMLHILAGSFRLMILKWKFSKFEFDLVKEGNLMLNTVIQLIKNQ